MNAPHSIKAAVTPRPVSTPKDHISVFQTIAHHHTFDHTDQIAINNALNNAPFRAQDAVPMALDLPNQL